MLLTAECIAVLTKWVALRCWGGGGGALNPQPIITHNFLLADNFLSLLPIPLPLPNEIGSIPTKVHLSNQG